MKLSFIFSALMLMLLFTSCNLLSGEEKEFDTLMQKVIDVHDEVMPKMGEVSTLIKRIDPKVDTTAIGKPYAKAQQDLKDSYDFMMKWMSDFSDTFPYAEDRKADSKELSKQMELLKQEEVKVNQLKDHINSSIKNAKKLLEKS